MMRKTPTVELLITNIGQLCTLHGRADESGPRRREALADVGSIEDAAMAVGSGRIVAAGAREEVLAQIGSDSVAEVVNAHGRAVIPGFVDPHTHTVFGRMRQDEYERRIRGETYLEIAAAGGGIKASVEDLRRRSQEDLTRLTADRLRQMLRHGTTTVEIKSGYGLTRVDEVKSLKAARAAASEVGIGVVLTCLAAHEIPPEFADNRAGYVELICEEILPQVTNEGLATRCDVFCEPSVFDLDETRTILERAAALGLNTTVHADELAAYGGAALAAEMGASSADHLIRIDADGVRALAGSDTIATLLPGTVFSLGINTWPPARDLVDRGAAIALATDFNPGSCPILSVPLIMSIACSRMRLTPAEALCAATLNAAWAIGQASEVGSLGPGRKADFLILDGDDYRLIPYRAGHNPVLSTWREGRLVAGNCP